MLSHYAHSHTAFSTSLENLISPKVFLKSCIYIFSFVKPCCLCKPSSLVFGQAVRKQQMSVSNCFLILGFELHRLSADALLKSLLALGV